MLPPSRWACNQWCSCSYPGPGSWDVAIFALVKFSDGLLSSSISLAAEICQAACSLRSPYAGRWRLGPAGCAWPEFWATRRGLGNPTAGCQPLLTHLHHCSWSPWPHLPWERPQWRLITVVHPKLRQPFRIPGSMKEAPRGYETWVWVPANSSLPSACTASSSKNGWVLSPCALCSLILLAAPAPWFFFFFWWIVYVLPYVNLILRYLLKEMKAGGRVQAQRKIT